MKFHFYKVPVECRIPYSDETKLYYDPGVLILPDSYTEVGEPTRLVINCHGAGGTVSTDDAAVYEQVLTRYLLANGYAIMDVNGLPEEFSQEFNVHIRNNIGSYIAVNSYVWAYHYCMENYNLKPEVFVHGGSMGGISSTNLVLSGQIPVIAQTLFCPVLDAYNHIFLHPWGTGEPRDAQGIIHSFQKDAEGNWIYDKEKMVGFDPATSDKVHPCPLFICHSANDNKVDPKYSLAYLDRAKAQGVETGLLYLPDGLHEPQAYGAPIDNPSGNTLFEGEQLRIRPGVEALFNWIHTHNPK